MRGQARSCEGDERTFLVFRLRQWWSYAQVSMGAVLGSSLLAASAFAQITPDQTLGPESSVIVPNTSIDGSLADQVEGGATRGNALFHSFTDFSVLSGQRVYFANPAGIDQIINRVTGENVSNIFGTLGVDGSADLYLLNPNGVVFGPDAQIDVRGSFLVSTADGFLFADGLQYSARTPDAAPLLTLAVSPGLQYGSQTPGSIVNEANIAIGQDLILSGGSINSTGALIAPNGQLTLEAVTENIAARQLAAKSATLLAADDIVLTESQLWTVGGLQILAGDTVRVRDTSEQPVQLAAGGDLLVQGDNAIDIFALNHPDSGFFAWRDMVLRSPNPIGGDAHYWAGGNFRIENEEGDLGQLFSPDDPIIQALGDVEFDAYIGTSLHILTAGSVTANFIVITGSEDGPPNGAPGNDYLVVAEPGLSLALPSDPTTGAIDGSSRPTLDIRAGMIASEIAPPSLVFGSPISGYDGLFNPDPDGTVDNFIDFLGLIQPPPASIEPATSADITISDIAIAEPDGQVLLTNAFEPNLALAGGNIRIGQLSNPPIGNILGFPGGTGIVAAGVGGNGGDVMIAARQNIDIDNRSIVTASDASDAGDITLLANGDINIDTGLVAASGLQGGNVELTSYSGEVILDDAIVGSYTAGNTGTGNVTVDASSVSLTNAAAIVNATEGNIPGGTVSIQADELLQITETGTNRTITLDEVTLPPGTGIVTNTVSGPSSSGDIVINAGQLQIQNQAPDDSDNRAGLTTAIATVEADAGDISIDANTIELSGRNAEIATSSVNGAAGDVTLTTQDDISFLSGSFVEAIGLSGGNIRFESEAGNIRLSDSIIGTYTFGAGEAGDITFDANSIFLSEAAAVINATEGVVTGGNITLQATDSLEIIDNGEERSLSFTTDEDLFGLLPAGTGIAANTVSGPARGGDVFVDVSHLSVLNKQPEETANRAGITTASRSTTVGDAGSIQIDAELIELIGNDGNDEPFSLDDEGIGIRDIIDIPTGITSSTSGDGRAGAITVNTERLVIKNQAGLTSGSASTLGSGDGNTLRVNATESIELQGLAVIGSGTRNAGTSGDVFIDIPAGRITLQDGALIGADTTGAGDAGNLFLNADQIEVNSGSRIGSSTSGAGNAGILVIPNASQIIVDGVSRDESRPIVPSRIFFSSIRNPNITTEDAGDAGELDITAQALIVRNGGEIAGDTEGSGRAGLLAIASESIQVDGADSRISFESRGAGNARGIEIETDSLVVANQGTISVSGSGTGISGDLGITADSIFLDQQAELRSETQASEGGNIRLTVAENIIMSNNGDPDNATLISASASGEANGGNIEFDVEGSILAVLEENSDVLAFAESGQGGNITGDAEGIIYQFRDFQGEPSPESDFTAIATDPLGTDGNVDVPTALPEEPPLPDDFASDDIARGCIAASVPLNSPDPQSSFTFVGRGGLPSQPVSAQDTAALMVGLVDAVEGAKVPAKDATNVEDDRGDSVQQPLLFSCIRP